MNNDIGGIWRTVGGRRIFIKDGEDLETAMKNSGKFNKKEKIKDDYTILEEKADKLYEIYNKNSSANDRIQHTAKEYYKEIGYDAKPQTTNEKTYNELKNNGYKEIQRGIRGYGEDGKNGVDFYNQYKEGEYFIGNQRVFGSGTYYTYENDGKNTANRYSNKDGVTYYALIDKDAKIITSTKLNELKTEYSKKVIDKSMKMSKDNMEEASKYYTKMNTIINSDNGIFASSLGYDAIDVEDAKYIVSMNRSKIILKK